MGVRRFRATILAFIVGLVGTARAAQVGPTDWEKKRFLAKAAKVLNARDLTRDELNEFMKLTPDEVIDRLMANGAFYDRVVDFGFYYLKMNTRPSRERRYFYPHFKDSPSGSSPPSGFEYKVYRTSNTFPLRLSRAVFNNTGIFAAWEPTTEAFIEPSSEPYLSARFPDADSATLTRDEARQMLKAWYLDFAHETLAVLDDLPPDEAREVGCLRFSELTNFTDYGLEIDSFNPMGSSILPVILNCFFQPDLVELSKIREGVKKTIAVHEKLANLATAYDLPAYLPRRINDIATVSNATEPVLDLHPEFFGDEQWREGLPNSSTNFSRRRAAYVLDAFLCDDLTPIDIVSPDRSLHTEGKHASEPGCQACHYKLDPMAGFFMNRGSGGTNFFDTQAIYFDDGVFLSKESYKAYINSWRDDHSPSGWNVGYIRSNLNPAKNDYADLSRDSFDQLFTVLKRAPEVKSCFVQKMAKYFISEDQAFDGAWLSEVEAEMAKEQYSGLGFKNALKKLLTGKTFREPNPDPKVCYDVVDEASTVPCPVRSILSKSCASCHSIEEFPYDDPSFRDEMRERLTSRDPKFRMPLKREMSDQDRIMLVKWLSE